MPTSNPNADPHSANPYSAHAQSANSHSAGSHSPAPDPAGSFQPSRVTGWAARIKAFLAGRFFGFRRAQQAQSEAGYPAAATQREQEQTQREEISALQVQLAQSQQKMASLLAERDAAVETLRKKTEFFASVCHEIRTPLNGVLGMMELLSLSELDAEQSRLAQSGVRSGHLLRALLTDVMDFSRRGLEQFELRPEPFDPRELTHTVCQMLQPADTAMGVSFTCEVAPEVPDTVVGSPVRIAQVISNLASNALKFTPQGTVRVLVAMEPDSALPGHTGRPGNAGRLSITVSDTGIGIPASQQRRIFQPFHQAHPIDTAQRMEAGNRHGVGLGLSITRNLVEAMNGTISVESSEGQGSLFHVSIPVVIPAKADSHPRVVSHPAVDAPSNGAVERTGAISLTGGYGPVAGITDEAPLRALVAEDNPVNRLLLDRQLQKLGCHVVTCESAEEAIEVWSSFRPHLVFTDHHMPGMSGLDFARTIREREQALPAFDPTAPFSLSQPAPASRIILVTGSYPEVFAAGERPAEIDGLLPKPFAMRELAALLAQERETANAPPVSNSSANDSLALTA